MSYSSVVEIGHALCGEGGEGRGERENESWGSVSGKCLYTTGKLHTSNNTVNTKQVYLTHTVTLIFNVICISNDIWGSSALTPRWYILLWNCTCKAQFHVILCTHMHTRAHTHTHTLSCQHYTIQRVAKCLTCAIWLMYLVSAANGNSCLFL